MPPLKEFLREIALTEGEYTLIVERLGREPNIVELGIFGALWSEHCGYKHSKPLLRLLPSESPRSLVPRGAENAGVVEVGGGWAVALKIESHNHPSAVEPFQGAATGVGGIVRDILAVGARPMALLNSLRFGPLSEPGNRYLFTGVVGGISWYGNCIGVPDVGGEVAFAPPYSANPLVNCLCAGLLPAGRLVRARAEGPGNLLILIGADTGRDGLHGASGLASRAFEGERELRPAVQVGNPFLEKVLIEAVLELLERFPEAVVGVQDLGAGGLAVACAEAAARAGTGVRLDLSRVPRREAGMTPYEVLLSESQERMLLIVRRGEEGKVREVCEKWDLPWALIGGVTDDGLFRAYDGDTPVAALPLGPLAEPPEYRVEGQPGPDLRAARNEDLSALPLPPLSPAEALRRLLSSPTVASKEWVYRQYDHQVLTNTVLLPGKADAALLRLRGTKGGIALTVDGNGRIAFLDPYVGGALAVAEACRNLSCVGAEPVALTDGLNLGDPEKPQVAWHLEGVVRGMAEACRALDVPVVSGNVSLYNETQGRAVYPTPIVGALGVVEDITRTVTMAFRREGDLVVLLGEKEVRGDPSSLAGSEALYLLWGKVAGRPTVDLEAERRVQRLCRGLIREGLVRSAHDLSEGGLAVALAECAIAGGLGFQGEVEVKGRWDSALFGEAGARVLVSLPPEALPALERRARAEGVPFILLGRVGGRGLRLPRLLEADLESLADAWHRGLERALEA